MPPALNSEADSPRLHESEVWDAAASERAQPSPLLQSWAWGDVQARSGWDVERVRLPGGGMASVLLRGRTPLRWAYVPRGPLPAGTLPQLIAWARDRGLARLRVEPESPPALVPALENLGFTRSTEVQPRHTVIVDLGPEEQMLAAFKPKTRYNIRLALKRGVTVDEGNDAAELAAQATETSHRQSIRLPPRTYYELLLERLPFCRTYVAKHDGQPLAAILVAEHDGRAYYLFGGASGAKRELMPAYAAQWAALCAAARRGCRDYDLWGVPPAPHPDHPWYGLWQFKTGFNGRLIEYAGCWDLKLSRAASAVAAQEALVAAVRRVRARS